MFRVNFIFKNFYEFEVEAEKFINVTDTKMYYHKYSCRFDKGTT